MSEVIFYTLAGNRIERDYTSQELADIEAARPTENDLLQEQIDALRATITDDIRDRAMLGDTEDLKSIYDQIKALESQKA